ncbi:MAG: NAD-dependent epimerase/dehydratase family protein [Nocardioidaceae bacterium]
MGSVVLVTGVSQDLGGRFARSLAGDPDVDGVIGVDVVPPRADLGAVHFVRADIRNPVIAKVIVDEGVDTVVHMSVIAAPGRAGGRTSMKETNVIGTMQLLAACQKAPRLRKLVVKSSTAIYGASSKDPAMFSEEMAPKRMPRAGFAKDSVEVEGYVRGFARRRPDVTVTMLRLATLIGPTVDTAITRYFALPVVPTVLGYDARLQFCHEQDALDALGMAVRDDVHGSFNIAGDGALALSQAIRRVGRPAMPVPSFAVSRVATLIRSTRLGDFSPEQVEFLTFGRGVDTTRMRDVLGFRPRFDTPAAFADYARCIRPGLVDPGHVAAAERRLNGLLIGDGQRG